MNKMRKIGGIVLLLAIVAFILINVLPNRDVNEKATKKVSYEPKFRDEGDLAFISKTSGDTIQTIDIEIAETLDEKAYGMMFRKSMDESTGMLFLMGTQKQQSFWMRNTYVSLDIIYINRDFEIVSIQEKAQPLNDQSLPSTGPALYVLEVIGGYCEKYGIGAGDRIQYIQEY